MFCYMIAEECHRVVNTSHFFRAPGISGLPAFFPVLLLFALFSSPAIALIFKFLFCHEEFFLRLVTHDRVCKVQVGECLVNDRCHRKAGQPFGVSRNDVPGSPLGARVIEEVFVGIDVLLPVLPFPDI